MIKIKYNLKHQVNEKLFWKIPKELFLFSMFFLEVIYTSNDKIVNSKGIRVERIGYGKDYF